MPNIRFKNSERNTPNDDVLTVVKNESAESASLTEDVPQEDREDDGEQVNVKDNPRSSKPNNKTFDLVLKMLNIMTLLKNDDNDQKNTLTERDQGEVMENLNEISKSGKETNEHVSKIENKGALKLDGIEEILLEIKADSKGMSLKVTEIEKNEKKTFTSVTEIRRWMEEMERKVEETDANVTKLSTRMKEMERKREETDANVTGMSTRMNEMERRVEETDANATRMSTRMNEMERRVEETDANATGMSTRMNEMERRMEETDANATGMSTRMNEIERRVEETYANATGMSTRMNEMERSVEETDANATGMSTRMNEMERKVEETDANVTGLSTRMNGLERMDVERSIKVHEIERNERMTSKKVENLEFYLIMKYGVIEWPIGKIGMLNSISSPYFRPVNHPYKCGFDLLIDTEQLCVNLLIYGDTHDDSLKWPFRANVTIAISDKFDRQKSKSIKNCCNISRPSLGTVHCSDHFLFKKSNLSTAGIILGNTESKEMTECIIICDIESEN